MTTTPSELRQGNRARVLRELLLARETTRSHLATVCGLSPATVATIVAALIEEGLAEEIGSLPSGGGRPIGRLAPRADGAYLLGADVGERGVMVELFDLSLRRLDQEFRALPTRFADRAQVAEALRESVTTVRERHAAAGRREPVGLGIGVPGIVEAEGGEVTIYAQSLGWPPTGIDQLYGVHDLPVLVDNGAKTMAAAEMWLGAARDVEHCVIALLGGGIGLGVISGGRVLRGQASSLGEWGHTKVSIGGPLCACGNRGCLEAHAGGAAVLHRWDDAGGGAPGTEEAALRQLVATARAGDVASKAVVEETIKMLAIGFANLVNLFNPEKIIVGGWVGMELVQAFGPHFEGRIREHSLDRPGEQFRLEACALGDDAVALGAALLPLEACVVGDSSIPRVVA